MSILNDIKGKKRKAPTLNTHVLDAGARLLWVQYPIAENLIISNRIMVLTAAIAGITFDRVNDAVLHSLNNAGMI